MSGEQLAGIMSCTLAVGFFLGAFFSWLLRPCGGYGSAVKKSSSLPVVAISFGKGVGHHKVEAQFMQCGLLIAELGSKSYVLHSNGKVANNPDMDWFPVSGVASHFYETTQRRSDA